MFTAHYKKHYVDSEQNNISTALFDWELRERDIDMERRRGGERQDTLI